MNGHTNHTPCGGDPEAAIIALEKRALERWNQGDPDGFLELTSGDVVYFDPALGRKLIGKKALGEYYGTVRGKIRIDTYRMIDPVVRLSPALPSWHTITRPLGMGRCSGCTARKFTRPQRPAVGRSSIRTGLSPGRTIEAVRRGRIFAVRGFGMQIARHGAWKKESVNGSHNAGTWIGPYCTCACSREA